MRNRFFWVFNGVNGLGYTLVWVGVEKLIEIEIWRFKWHMRGRGDGVSFGFRVGLGFKIYNDLCN